MSPLPRLADDHGRLRILAIDQRAVLVKAIAQDRKIATTEVPRADVVRFKRAVVENLGRCASAVLIDDEYSIPDCLDVMPRGAGLLFPAENSEYERAGAQNREYRERLSWNVDKVLAAKPDGIKLVLHYRGDGDPEIRRHQQSIARQVGEFCRRHGLVFVLEPLTYPLFDDEFSSVETWARRRPGIIIDFVKELSKPEYGVGLLKIEFPADLDVFSPAEVRGYCAQVHAATSLPWALLSMGVPDGVFASQLQYAMEAGTRGFVCGRSIWKSAIPFLSDPAALKRELQTACLANFERFNAILNRG